MTIAFLFLAFAAPQVDLPLAPVEQAALIDDIVQVDLVAHADSIQEFAAIDALLAWDPARLEFVGTLPGSFPWLTAGFLPDPDGINDDVTDGEALFTALSPPTSAASVPPDIIVVTLRFRVLDAGQVSLLASSGAFGRTRVIGVTPGTEVTGDISGTAEITLGAPVTRICVAESVPSPNTGLKTKMILETQDAGGNLLPFDDSIAGNASPNRLMMVARDAPGPGNGGVTNIGYFIMGTGTNTFVPPGSIGPMCIAPGIKRYLPPVNMTDESITFHDGAGTPTTLVGQGFSRAALGTGAHPIGDNIGGTLGFKWSFQAWHRDTPGDSNLSDAITVDFVP